ncbi:GTPase Era [Bartonella bacilliformis str. Heidi Mejia]|uniref:GTPase Era n=2 Tax=Bartonella bacilliformis TaxID=774 RepID=A1US37_BARBK|nr:GTPase Era [Bartonella bacilliformis]ABM45148.1 GTP-binding protein Era [Bartonella bacilliformis KC583]AMG85623.1 GTPase Era [Bartonella bacilliformis]EKS45039.1 GTPase Era [Bartonella bacilliformis INS]EYS90082.1 GTPase Era [Bartonella bacilliformis San Pedro600-02]EYS92245.1 GTPase Era [Bartonella bacilliformis str. Heidi Mejia]
MDEITKTRFGFVSLVGVPNAGKSTLVNQLVGTKVSIVTHKVQTTRALVRGIVIHEKTQIVLVDTPGIFRPRKRLERAMVSAAWSGIRDADALLVLIDVQNGLSDEVNAMLDNLANIKQDKILVLNKIDTVAKSSLLALTAKINERVNFLRTFMISALNGSGCKDLLDYLSTMMQPGPWCYPEDQISDMPMRQLAAEITREKLFFRLHEELPYASTVETENWEERPDGSVKINQVIYVERESQKKILLGTKGHTIKAIGQAARKELTEILEQRVSLFLFVKVRDNWDTDPERYRAMVLDFSK